MQAILDATASQGEPRPGANSAHGKVRWSLSRGPAFSHSHPTTTLPSQKLVPTLPSDWHLGPPQRRKKSVLHI